MWSNLASLQKALNEGLKEISAAAIEEVDIIRA